MSEDDEKQIGHGCAAYGCPLPGCYSDSTQGGGTWRCFVHEGRATVAFDAITVEIKRRAPLFRLLGRMNDASGMAMHWPKIAPMVSGTLRQMGRDDLVPDETETTAWWAYRARLRATLRKECIEEAGAQSVSKGNADPMRRITELLEIA